MVKGWNQYNNYVEIFNESILNKLISDNRTNVQKISRIKNS